MTTKQILTSTTIAMMAPLAAFAITTDWQADGGNFTGNWTNSGNWDEGVPGVDTLTDPSAKINNTTAVVTANSDVTTGTPIQQFELLEGELNINAGGKLDVGSNNKDFRSGAVSGSTANIDGGTFIVRHQFQHGRFGAATMNVSSGTLDYVGDSGAGRVFRLYDGILNVSGTGLVNNVGSAGTGTGARIGIDTGTNAINLSGSATFNSNSNYQMNFTSGVTNHSFMVSGSNVSATLGDVNAYVQNAASDAVFKFVSDSFGISTVTTDDITFDGGAKNAALIVDTTLLSGSDQTLTLFDYVNISGGAFEDISVIGGNFTLGGINYAGGDGSAITLDLVAIPEPSTFALMTGVAVFALVTLRRRTSK